MPNPNGSLAIDERVFGSIVIKEVLEHGPFGTSYLGHQELPARQVVVKVAHQSLMNTPAANAIAARFATEVQALSRIQHERLASVYMAGTYDESAPMTVLSHVQGTALSATLEHDRLDAVSTWHLFHDLGDLLATLHAQGITHPEFEPRNIVIGDELEDGRTTANVTGFGLRLLPGVASMTVEMEHAVRFFAPEQLCDALETRSNMFSLGAMLWWSLTGTRFLHDLIDTGSFVRYLVSLPSPPDIRAVEPTIPANVAGIVDGLLQPKPAERLSASEFCERWAGVLGDLARFVKARDARSTEPAAESGKLIPISATTERAPNAMAPMSPPRTVLLIDDSLERLCSIVGLLDEWELLTATTLAAAQQQASANALAAMVIPASLGELPAADVVAALSPAVGPAVAIVVFGDGPLSPALRSRRNVRLVGAHESTHLASIVQLLVTPPVSSAVPETRTSPRTPAQADILALAPLIADLAGSVESDDRPALQATADVLAGEAHDAGLTVLANKSERLGKVARHGTDATLRFLADAIENEFSNAFRRNETHAQSQASDNDGSAHISPVLSLQAEPQ